MANNNVAILSIMSKFDEKSAKDAAKRAGKVYEDELQNLGDIKLDEKLSKNFNKAMDLLKGKFKKVNLSSYINKLLDSIFSNKDAKEKFADIDDFIKKINLLNKAASGQDINAFNTLSAKQIDALISRTEKLAQKQEEINEKTREYNREATKIAKSTRTASTIDKKYGSQDYSKTLDSLKKSLGIEKEFTKEQEESVNNLAKMVYLYQTMEKAEPQKGTAEAIRYSKDLLVVTQKIKEEREKVDSFTNKGATRFIDENELSSVNKVSDYTVNKSKEDFVKANLNTLKTQEAKIQSDLTTYIIDSVQRNLQKVTTEANSAVDKAEKRVEGLQNKIDTLKSSSKKNDDVQVIGNIVDETQLKSLEDIEDRLYEIYDKDSDGNATNKELKEFIQLYKQYEQLISKDDTVKFDPELKTEYEYILKSSDSLKKYSNQLDETIAKQKESSDINALNSDQNSTTTQLSKQKEEIKKTIEAEQDLSNIQKSNSNIAISVEAKQALEDINAVKESLENIPNEKNIKISVNNTDYSSVPLLSNEEGKTVNMFRGIKNAWSGLVNDKGIGFFTDKLELAVDYADELAKDGKVIQANLSLHNPLEVEGNGARWDQIKFNGVIQKTDDIIEKAKQLGYDGVIFKNIRDGFTDTETDLSNVVAVFDAMSVKNEQVIGAVKAGTGELTKIESTTNSMADTVVDSQNKIQNELQETQEQAEKTAQAVKEVATIATTPQESNISLDDSSATSAIDKQLSSTKELIEEKEKLSNIQNKIISFKPKNNDAVINEQTEETLQKSSEYASELLEAAQQIVRLANNNVGFISSEDATEIEKLYQLFPELRDFRYNDMSLDFMSKSDLDEGWMDAFMDFSATLPEAAEYFEMIDEFSSHLSDDGRFWGNEQDFAKDFLHVDPNALDRVAEVNNALNEALGTEEDYTSKYKEIRQQLKDGSIDIQDAIRDILQLEFPNNKIMETPDGVWVAPEKLNKTTKSIKDVSSAVSDVSNKVLQFPGRNVVSEQDKIQEELQQTQDEIDSTQSKYQSLLDVAKKQLDDDRSLNYNSGKTTETKAFDNFTFNEQAKRNGYFDVWSNDYEELIALMDKTEEELKSGSIGFDEAIDRMVAAYQKYDTATKIDVGGFDFLDGVENVPSVLSDTEKAVLNENKAIKESEYTLQDYINTYLELKKVKESSLSVDSKITGVTSNGRPIIKDGSDESFKAELMMKDMESEVLQIYGKDLSALANEHIKASESAKEHAKAENQVTQAIKESSSTASQDQRKDAFPGSSTETKPETEGMEQVEKATEEAIQAKKDFATANEGVQSSIDGSENPLKLEAELMEQIAKSAREAADAKKEFVEANKQVKDSAEGSDSKNKKKDKYANIKKVSSDEFLDRYDEFLAVGNKVASQKGGTILGNSVNISYDIENELVNVSAKIKDVDGTWRSFSAKLSSDLQVFPTGFRTITKGINKLDNELANFGKDEVKTQETDEQIQKFKELNTAIDDYASVRKRIANGKAYDNDEENSQKLLKTINEIMGKADGSATILSSKQLSDAQDRLDKINKTISEIQQKNAQNDSNSLLKIQDNATKKLSSYTNASTYTPEFIERVESKITEIKQLKITDPKDVARLKEIDSEVQKIVDDSKLLENKLVKQESHLADIISQMKIYRSENTNMSSSQKKSLNSMISFAEELAHSGKVTAEQIEQIKIAFSGLKAEISETGRTGKNFFSQIRNRLTDINSKFIAQFLSWQDWIMYIRQAAEMVTELNTQIIELAKVSEDSISKIYADFDSYANIAKEMGSTISDTIAATTAWSKNGYNIPDSKKLAEVSLLYKNVGDGINIDEANESLVSTLKGFKLEADQAEHIVDVFNEVSNNEAISSSGIGEALQRSAASFNAANTSLEKSVALVTATNSVIQDPDKVGNMWKTKFYCLYVQKCA